MAYTIQRVRCLSVHAAAQAALRKSKLRAITDKRSDCPTVGLKSGEYAVPLYMPPPRRRGGEAEPPEGNNRCRIENLGAIRQRWSSVSLEAIRYGNHTGHIGEINESVADVVSAATGRQCAR